MTRWLNADRDRAALVACRLRGDTVVLATLTRQCQGEPYVYVDADYGGEQMRSLMLRDADVPILRCVGDRLFTSWGTS